MKLHHLHTPTSSVQSHKPLLHSLFSDCWICEVIMVWFGATDILDEKAGKYIHDNSHKYEFLTQFIYEKISIIYGDVF